VTACQEGHVEIAEWLLSMNPDQNMVRKMDGREIKGAVSERTLLWILRSSHFDSEYWTAWAFEKALYHEYPDLLALIPEYAPNLTLHSRRHLFMAACCHGVYAAIEHIAPETGEMEFIHKIVTYPIRRGPPDRLATTYQRYPEIVARIFRDELIMIVRCLDYRQLQLAHAVYPFMTMQTQLVDLLKHALCEGKQDTADAILLDHPNILRSEQVSKSIPNGRGLFQQSIFCQACSGGNLAAAQQIWSIYSDRILASDRGLQFVFEESCRRGRHEIFDWLIAVAPGIDRSRGNVRSFRESCVTTGSVEILDRLVAGNPDLLTQIDLEEMFFAACKIQATSVMEWLLTKSDQINVCSIDRETFTAISTQKNNAASEMLVDVTRFNSDAKYIIHRRICYLIGETLPNPPHSCDLLIHGITVRPGIRVSRKRAEQALASIVIKKRAMSAN